MEAILSVVGLVIVYSVGMAIIRAIFGAGTRAVKKVVTGRDTYYGPPQLQLTNEKLEDINENFKRVNFRGALPNQMSADLSFCVSAFDSTDKELKPILSLIEPFEEPETLAFQATSSLGHVPGESAITDWAPMGGIFPDLIQPPYSGRREITLVIRIFDTQSPPSISLGFGDREESLWTGTIQFEHNFTEKGYTEAEEHREESQAISLKIGMAVAMADGSLDDEEGEVLKAWILKEVSPYSEEKQSNLKQLYNNSMREAYASAQSGSLALSPLVERLSEIGDKKSKYAALELCVEVMAADGVADPEEMAMIHNVAKSLNLDMTEIDKMKEQVTLNLSVNIGGEKELEALVGLDNSWEDDQKRKHLRQEFQKWSNRMSSLSEGEERESAQQMLNNIALLRKKYG
jgi:tellurite resistance protein